MIVDPKHDLRGIDTRATEPAKGISVFILHDPKDILQYTHWIGRACRHVDTGHLVTLRGHKGATKQIDHGDLAKVNGAYHSFMGRKTAGRAAKGAKKKN